MLKTKRDKIQSIETKILQLQNQKQRILQQQKLQARKDRTRRLCSRAGLFESILPATINLTEEQFKVFLTKLLRSNESSTLLGKAFEDALLIETQISPSFKTMNETEVPSETKENREDSGMA